MTSEINQLEFTSNYKVSYLKQTISVQLVQVVTEGN